MSERNKYLPDETHLDKINLDTNVVRISCWGIFFEDDFDIETSRILINVNNLKSLMSIGLPFDICEYNRLSLACLFDSNPGKIIRRSEYSGYEELEGYLNQKKYPSFSVDCIDWKNYPNVKHSCVCGRYKWFQNLNIIYYTHNVSGYGLFESFSSPYLIPRNYFLRCVVKKNVRRKFFS
jgi:hypothetical protein